MKAFLVTLFAITGSLANAGGATTGGGGVVYCQANSSVELFDYYEGRILRNLSVDLGPSALTHMAKVKFALDRLAVLDAALAGQLWPMAQDFETNAAFIPNAKLDPINDVNGVFLPAGCNYVQAVAQREPMAPGDPFFIVDKNLWDLMSEETKAGIILHEVIYRYSRQIMTRTDSSTARYYNSRISSRSIATLNAAGYLQLLKIVTLPPSFLWQDSLAQWWYTSTTWSWRPPIFNCKSIGMRQAYEHDIVKAYPEFGLAIKAQGILDFYPDYNVVEVRWDQANWNSRGYLNEEGYFASNPGRSAVGKTFCVSASNPIPL